jgi:heme oxygenase
MNFGNLQPASRLGRSIVTQIATAQTNTTQSTTPFGSQTRHVRLVSTLAARTAVESMVAHRAAKYSGTFAPGQVLNFISTSTSTGYVSLTEMS